MTNATLNLNVTIDNVPDPTGQPADLCMMTDGAGGYKLAAGVLPAVTGADDGKVLKVGALTSGVWGVGTDNNSGGGGSVALSGVCNGRLTLTSNTPVTISDVTAATTIYFTPFGGNQIALYDGSGWVVNSFSQLSLSVPATANTNYDVFVYDNAGLTMEAVAWTNGTTRATALATQNGVLVKNGASGRRYVGSFRTVASGQTEDSAAKRFVWNYYNRCKRLLKKLESTSTWNYSSSTIRQANGSTANQVESIIGVVEDTICINLSAAAFNSTATLRSVGAGVGVNSTTSIPYQGLAPVNNAMSTQLDTTYEDYPSLGYSFYSWNEQGAGTDTQTWASGGGRGIYGHVMA